MTDKEKKNKIADILLEFYEEYQGNIPNRPMIPSIYANKIIDSLQEEPISSIWHDASEKSNEPEDVVIINPSDNTGEVLTRCVDVYQGRIWAYTSVLLKLDNPCKIGKNLQEEPVSEELEKAANEWDTKASFTPFYMTLDDKGNPNGVRQDYTTHAESFKAGAKWKEQQMMGNTIDAHCFGFQGAALFSFRLPTDNYLVGSEVKVIVIKED